LQSRQSLHSGFKQELETYIKVLIAMGITGTEVAKDMVSNNFPIWIE